MRALRPHSGILPAGILAVSLAAVYLLTMAPDLTWANSGADGGDLISAAATGGVAHPTGYPLYLLLAQLFQRLPVGSLAFRTNLMSACFAVMAALLVYAMVKREVDLPGRDWIPALAAGYAAGLSPLLWSQAVITEVYALQAFLVALILFLSGIRASASSAWRLDCARGGLMGLAMGNHLTTLLLIPAAFAVGSVRSIGMGGSRRLQASMDWGSLLRQLIAFLMGCFIYAILPFRAAVQPPVNWGNAVTPKQLWWLVSGQLYQFQVMHAPLEEILVRTGEYARLLLHQFGMAGVTLGLLSLVLFFRPSRLLVLSIWTAGVSAIFALGYSPEDSYLYLIPAFLAFAIWIGLGTAGCMQVGKNHSERLAWVIGLGAILWFMVLGGSHWQEVDASRDTRAVEFGSQVMRIAPADAIVFAKGDRAVFALWYFHFALGQRRDLSIVASELLHHGWYQQTLKSSDPGLVLPGEFPWPETVIPANPSRPTCFVEYTDQAQIDCTSPGKDAGVPEINSDFHATQPKDSHRLSSLINLHSIGGN